MEVCVDSEDLGPDKEHEPWLFRGLNLEPLR